MNIYLNEGNGRFQAGAILDTGCTVYPSATAVGDFNRSNAVDLAVLEFGCYRVAVHLGNGAGDFSAATLYPYAPFLSASEIDTADFNEDGVLDLLVNESIGAQLLLGDGVGSFTHISNAVTGEHSSKFLIADFNNDAKLDTAALVFTPNNTGYLSLFVGNGDGTFQSPTVRNVEPFAGSGVQADFNNDGKMDFATFAAGMIRVYLQSHEVLVEANLSALDFGTQRIGTRSTGQQIVVSSTGGGTLSVSGVSLSGADPEDYLLTTNCPRDLPSGQTCDVDVAFRPTATGLRTATLNINDNAHSSPQTVSLTGTGN
ncbi:MAG: choice-of-anchor D domain-containing protein [Acidobacteriales bacterium]|nr:choice-of-anchor D domain-containing protein [Terriglobales bacterium]